MLGIFVFAHKHMHANQNTNEDCSCDSQIKALTTLRAMPYKKINKAFAPRACEDDVGNESDSLKILFCAAIGE